MWRTPCATCPAELAGSEANALRSSRSIGAGLGVSEPITSAEHPLREVGISKFRISRVRILADPTTFMWSARCETPVGTPGGSIDFGGSTPGGWAAPPQAGARAPRGAVLAHVASI